MQIQFIYNINYYISQKNQILFDNSHYHKVLFIVFFKILIKIKVVISFRIKILINL